MDVHVDLKCTVNPCMKWCEWVRRVQVYAEKANKTVWIFEADGLWGCEQGLLCPQPTSKGAKGMMQRLWGAWEGASIVLHVFVWSVWDSCWGPHHLHPVACLWGFQK